MTIKCAAVNIKRCYKGIKKYIQHKKVQDKVSSNATAIYFTNSLLCQPSGLLHCREKAFPNLLHSSLVSGQSGRTIVHTIFYDVCHDY